MSRRTSVCTVCRVGWRWPSLAPRIAKLVSSSVSERDLIDDSFRVFASPRLVRFVEMEYGIPLECLPEAVQRVREVTKHLSFSLFPIEVRVSAAGQAQPGLAGRTVGLQFTNMSARRMSHIFSRCRHHGFIRWATALGKDALSQCRATVREVSTLGRVPRTPSSTLIRWHLPQRIR